MSKQPLKNVGIRLAVGASLVALVLGVGTTERSVRAQGGARGGEWPEFAGDSAGTKYSPLDQINADNVKSLGVVWRWHSPDGDVQRANASMIALRTSRNEDTPLMVKGVMYHVTGLGQVAAIDPAMGRTRWVYDPQSWKLGRPNNGGFLQRGLGYWTDGTIERLMVGTHDGYLLSLDAATLARSQSSM